MTNFSNQNMFETNLKTNYVGLLLVSNLEINYLDNQHHILVASISN